MHFLQVYRSGVVDVGHDALFREPGLQVITVGEANRIDVIDVLSSACRLGQNNAATGEQRIVASRNMLALSGPVGNVL